MYRLLYKPSSLAGRAGGYGAHALYLSWKVDDIDGLAIQAKSGDINENNIVYRSRFFNV